MVTRLECAARIHPSKPDQTGAPTLMTNHGGKREGAGRPTTGRKRRQYYVTDEEDRKIKELIEKLRASK